MPVTPKTSQNRPAPVVIHIFNGFQNPHGGSELEALGLYELLRQQVPVHLWASSSRADPRLLQQFSIRRIGPVRRNVPEGGTYVFVGAHWRNKLWPYLIRKPARLIYLYNTFHPKVITLTSRTPRLLGWPPVEYVVISEFQKRLSGLTDAVEVQPSPIDIERFVPRQHLRPHSDRLAIGRISRDTPDKHNSHDFVLYGELAAQGHTVRLQGATCVAAQIEHSVRSSGCDLALVQATSSGNEAAEEFLRGLDIFYYRSGIHVETFGRVVFEAMACGLPVVCHEHGGYAEWIRHGENGFLFNNTEQARTMLAVLIADPGLRRQVGAAARKTVEALYAPSAMLERAAFYLRKESPLPYRLTP